MRKSWGWFTGLLRASEEDDDEIRAWREERMRNYPTRSNIQRKVTKVGMDEYLFIGKLLKMF